MRKWWKILCCALALLPFACELPYIFHAMGVSPAERWNWCFGILALVLLSIGCAVFCVKDSLHYIQMRSFWRFASLLPPLLLLLFGAFRHIHLAFLIGGILLPYALAACLFGGKMALLLLPGCGMMALFCPSVGIILSTIVPLGGILLKSILAALLAVLLPCIAFFRLPRLKLEAFAFAALVLMIAGAYALHGHASSRRHPLKPAFDSLLSEHFKGVQDTVSAADRQFFGDSNINRFTFIDQKNNAIQVLSVSRIDNIHQIHPTTYCLRVNGYNILKEHILHIPKENDAQAMDMQELVAERNGERHIFWQWYSSQKYSTASFLLFRAAYSPAQNWSVYILTMPVASNIDETRRTLRTFILEYLPLQ